MRARVVGLLVPGHLLYAKARRRWQMCDDFVMRRGLLRVGLLVLTAACCSRDRSADDITTNSKHMEMSGDKEYMWAEGTWRRVSGEVGSQIPTVNSVRIECFRVNRSCYEYVARFIDPDDDPVAPSRMLLLTRNEFYIQAWDGDRILAKSEPRAADWYLEINLVTQTAQRTSQETEARGARGARRTPDQWILE